MKIAIVGAGGVGGYFGAQLAEHGHKVHLIARGNHLKAIKENGLTVTSPNGDLHVTSLNATDTPAEVGITDAVIVAVKGWQLNDVIPTIPTITTITTITTLSEPKTLILPLLNGVEASDTLNSQLKNGIVLNGLCGIIAKIEAPGKIDHIAIDPFVKFGLSNKPADLGALKKAFTDTSVDAQIPDDIARALWMKFLFIAPLSGMTSLTRATIGTVKTTPETRDMLISAITETMHVGCAVGINLTSKDIEKTINMIDISPADGTTSMQRDVQSGLPSELETQTGAIVRFGQKHNVETPVNTFIYNSLLPQEYSARSA